MKTFHDYESMGRLPLLESLEPPVLESYDGSAIVDWYSQIEDQLQRQLDNQEASRNYDNADRLRAFLKTWRENEITGSMNIEEIKPLKGAAEQQASDKWPLRNYFTALRRWLRRLISAQEKLPGGIDMNQNDPMKGALGGGAPPMSPDFGPEETAPGDLGLGGEEGAPGEGLPGEDLAGDKALDAAAEMPGETQPPKKPKPLRK